MEAQQIFVERIDAGEIYMGPFPPALQTLTTGGTVVKNLNQGSVRLTAAGAITGVILPVGVKHGQRLMCICEQASANTITFAAAGTSNIAGGATCVWTGLAAHEIVWDATTALWYQTGPVSQ